MLFNSLSFILVFLPVCLAAYYAAAHVSDRAAAFVLVAFSLLFYGWWNAWFLLLLLGSILFNYSASLLIAHYQGQERKQNIALYIAIIANIGLLFHYKYLYPLINWLDQKWWHANIPVQSVILPLGISFFTFTQIGYLVDCKAGIAKVGRFLDYMLFVTFFPHLIAGPILHHREMMPQFLEQATYRFKSENMAVGFTMFAVGLAKKVLIADHFAPIVGQIFAHPAGLSPYTAWGGALSYCLQLYFDFSGYSEMAIGLARLFGIRFPANFNSPFKAQSVAEYWQRFHMTLTRYITLYIYSPITLWVTRRRLARGKAVSKQATATAAGFLGMIAFPTICTMGLAGIWHGAGMQFLIFGLLHGFYIVVNHAWRIWGPATLRAEHIVNRLWRTALTLMAVVMAQVFFRSASVAAATDFLKSMAGLNGAAPQPPPVNFQPDFIESVIQKCGFDMQGWIQHIQFGAPMTMAAAYVFVLTMPNILQLLENYQPSLSKTELLDWRFLKWRPNIVWGLVFGTCAAIALLAVTGTTEFLYFQF